MVIPWYTVHPLFEAYEALGIDSKTRLSNLDKAQQYEVLRCWPGFWPNNIYTSLREVAAQYKNAGKKFPKTGFITSEEEFPIVNGRMLYIRQCYRIFYNVIVQTTENKDTCIAMTGTPGIGKSCFLIYFILWLLYESTDDKPNIVVFQPVPNKYYLYFGTEFVHIGSLDDFEHVLELPYVWYLSDNALGPEAVRAKTVITLSPKKKADETLIKFHEFFKILTVSGKLCMPLWTLSELSVCRETDLDEDIMCELFNKIGGVPRSVLFVPSKDPKHAIKAA